MTCEECGRRLARGEFDICGPCEERLERYERERASRYDEDDED